MFYATKIVSVGNGYVVDDRGNTLYFAGYLPVKVGDTVFTDGNIVFGNSKPKGSFINVNEPCGIPVLANNLRGYYTKNGSYKKFNIAGEDWIVNDKKNYAHESDEEDNIIDAEIADDGDLFTVTDGFFRECHSVKYNNHLFFWYHSAIQSIDSTMPYAVHAYINPGIGELITLGVEDSDLDIPVNIFKANNKIADISLKDYADIAKAKCLDIRDFIMSKSANLDEGVNYFQQPPPPDSFVAISYARVETFRINPHGDWDAIISAASYGYCFPYLLLNGSVSEAVFNSEVGSSKNFSEDLISCLDNIERYIFTENYFPFLQIDKYPAFIGSKKIDDVYTAEYKNYIEDKIKYYIPRIRFKHYEWFTVLFSSSFLFHVHNGDIVTIMHSSAGGGNNVYPTKDWTEEYATSVARYDFIVDTETSKNIWQFPLGEDFLLVGEGHDIKNISKDNSVILNLTNINKQDILSEIVLPYRVFSTIDATAYDFAAQNGYNDINSVWRRWIYEPRPYYKVSYNGGLPFLISWHPNYLNTHDKDNYQWMDGHFSSLSADGWFRFNPAIVALNNDRFLFGWHDGNLYKVNDLGTVEAVTDRLKNFRLRQLKKISKAKH